MVLGSITVIFVFLHVHFRILTDASIKITYSSVILKSVKRHQKYYLIQYMYVPMEIPL